MYITIFGGSSPRPDENTYTDAEKLGYELGKKGHIVITGGYIGTMEAVSKGASSADGHVIGITCKEIERWRPVHANKWIKEERKYATLHERLLALINSCDIAIALPGGIGTLTEIMLMWNRSVIGAINPKPIIFDWTVMEKRSLTVLLIPNLHIWENSEKRLLTYVDDIESALNIVNIHSEME